MKKGNAKDLGTLLLITGLIPYNWGASILEGIR